MAKMKGMITKVIRQIKVVTPKIIPLVTEMVEKKKAILKGKTGFVEMKPHLITRDLMSFLKSEGLSFEYTTVESRRGKAEIAGIRVKVMPAAHTHYDGGALIRIEEKDDKSFDNTNKVIEYLNKNGINIAKECIFMQEFSEEGACLAKMKELGA